MNNYYSQWSDLNESDLNLDDDIDLEQDESDTNLEQERKIGCCSGCSECVL